MVILSICYPFGAVYLYYSVHVHATSKTIQVIRYMYSLRIIDSIQFMQKPSRPGASLSYSWRCFSWLGADFAHAAIGAACLKEAVIDINYEALKAPRHNQMSQLFTWNSRLRMSGVRRWLIARYLR